MSENKWIGESYPPNISIYQWVDLLSNPKVFDANSLIIMKRLKDNDGMGTCTVQSNKYDEKKNFYNRGSSALAERIAKSIDTEPMIQEMEKVMVPTLYLVNDASSEREGSFIYKLREELKKH